MLPAGGAGPFQAWDTRPVPRGGQNGMERPQPDLTGRTVNLAKTVHIT